jgi:hypothetical protein
LFCESVIIGFIDATINFEPLPWLPSTPTLVIYINNYSGFLILDEAGDSPDNLNFFGGTIISKIFVLRLLRIQQ